MKTKKEIDVWYNEKLTIINKLNIPNNKKRVYKQILLDSFIKSIFAIYTKEKTNEKQEIPHREY